MFMLHVMKKLAVTSLVAVLGWTSVLSANAQDEGTATATAPGAAATTGGATAGGAAGGGGIKSGDYLKIIAENTTNILSKVNNLPEFIQNAAAFMLNWTGQDTSEQTANMQGLFTTWYNDSLNNDKVVNSLQTTLLTNFFNMSSLNATNFPNANDVTYQTLLGTPFLNPDPRNSEDKPNDKVDAGLNYIQNASGMLVPHTLLGTAWTGTQTNRLKYAAYFNSISAVQTYNAYAVSKLYADYKNNYAYTTTQTNLITQASSSDWFAKISSENIGIVLRQILMFDSQIFVMMTRLLDTEKQLLTAQSMTNTLLILLNQDNENNLMLRAQGKIP